MAQASNSGQCSATASSTVSHHIFQDIGVEDISEADSVLCGLEQFVCCLYGESGSDDVNQVRSDIFRSRYDAKSPQKYFENPGGIDLSLLPPCRSSLRMHYKRVQFQCWIWKNSHVARVLIPSPAGCGWKFEGENLFVDWTDGDIMPQKLIDILASEENPREYTSDDGDYENHEEEEIEEDEEVDNILDIIFEDDQED